LRVPALLGVATLLRVAALLGVAGLSRERTAPRATWLLVWIIGLPWAA